MTSSSTHMLCYAMQCNTIPHPPAQERHCPHPSRIVSPPFSQPYHTIHASMLVASSLNSLSSPANTTTCFLRALILPAHAFRDNKTAWSAFGSMMKQVDRIICCLCASARGRGLVSGLQMFHQPSSPKGIPSPPFLFLPLSVFSFAC